MNFLGINLGVVPPGILAIISTAVQAFYYHFKDKYDLINWIYYTETARFMSSYNKVEHWLDGMLDFCNHMRQNKTFYINALNTTGQKSFQEYLHNYIRDISISVIENTKTQNLMKKNGDLLSNLFPLLLSDWLCGGPTMA